MELTAGDLVLVPFPFTDLSSNKARPAVVLSSDAFHGSGHGVILAAVTSNIQNASFSVLFRAADLVDGRLPKTRRVKVGKLVTIDRSVIRRRIGRLRRPVLDQVYREMRALFPDLEL